MNIKNSVCVVTGASSGLGESIAKKLASQGAHLWLLARTDEKLEAVANAIQADGGKADYVGCDVTSPQSIQSAIEEIQQNTNIT